MMRAVALFSLGLIAIARSAGAADLLLTGQDLVPLPEGNGFQAEVTLPDPAPDMPFIDPARSDALAALMRHHGARGAGFQGVLYDNRDRGHSTLDPNLFPTLTRLRYGPDLIARGVDYGLAGAITYPAIVLGNSSTAIANGPAPRSQTRLAMTVAPAPDQAFRHYAGNALYIYPEHRDHDARDLFPGNWPYTVTTQGSSGSDQAFLEAMAMTLAAFPKATRNRLEAEGLIVPTLQMILRRSLRIVPSEAAYLSGVAHPPVFEGTTLVPGRMIAMAAAMTPDTIPPMVRLIVRREDFAPEADLTQSERLYTTPSAIARIWRNEAFTREMTLSAARTFDPNGRPLTFSWSVLRGDPDAITLEPFGADNAQARLRVTWHDPATSNLPGWLPGARIDIGVFASNGVYTSAPAILSILLPLHEGRAYDADGVLAGRTPIPGLYRDPLLFPESDAE